MQLYYSPGACSLATHIALLEGNQKFDLQKVDLKSHTLEDGRSFKDLNPKGYVPALRLDNGELVTENIAILSWIAEQYTALGPHGELGRTRLLEALAYISTEIHKSFAPLFGATAEDDKAKARERIGGKLAFVASQFKGPYFFGDAFTVADAYLFVMTTWANKFGIALPDKLQAFADDVRKRPTVQTALHREGLS